MIRVAMAGAMFTAPAYRMQSNWRPVSCRCLVKRGRNNIECVLHHIIDYMGGPSTFTSISEVCGDASIGLDRHHMQDIHII